jgi:GT2 family glycosyltransferase
MSRVEAAPAASKLEGREHCPDVSVCIVNWNCRAFLQACLQSLQAARHEVDLEIVVVDNASTDGAADMTAAEFPHVLLIRNSTNVGFARANNQGAHAARGRYLFFLNNDTVVPPGALRGLLEYAQAHPEAGLIGPQLRDGRGLIQLSFRRRPSLAALAHRLWLFRWTGLFRKAYRRYRGRDGDDHSTRSVEVLMGAALFVARSVFWACGPWDERFLFGGEDIDLCTRVGRRHAVVYHPAIEVLHHGRVSSRQHPGFALTHTIIGITRCLRQQGCSRIGLLGYKLAMTLDAPVQWLGHAGRYLWRRWRGKHAKAAKSLLLLRGVTTFLTRGLLPFWKT